MVFKVFLKIVFKYFLVDFTAPGMESYRKFMRSHAKKRPGNRVALAPQIFNDNHYCGDYEDFDLANEDGILEEFLKIPKKTHSSSFQEADEIAIRVHPQNIFLKAKIKDVKSISEQLEATNALEEGIFETMFDDEDIENVQELTIERVEIEDLSRHKSLPIETYWMELQRPIQKISIKECNEELEIASYLHSGDVNPGRLKNNDKDLDHVSSNVGNKKRGPILNSVTQFLDISMIYR